MGRFFEVSKNGTLFEKYLFICSASVNWSKCFANILLSKLDSHSCYYINKILNSAW